MKRNKDNKEWEISSAYYAMYFSLYSIMMKLGVKCEMHSCTLQFMKKFLSGFFSREDINTLYDACSARIDAQYYTDREIDEEERRRIIEKAPDLMVKCRETAVHMKEDTVDDIRKKLEEKNDRKANREHERRDPDKG
ncbi:MAG: hypothetical protein R6U32_06405 [Candidatus Woesearchaeota archaeon]